MADLYIQGLSKSYQNTVVALKDFHLDIPHGELVVIVGPSGCGKSTLLRLIAGLDTPDTGQISLNHADITNLPPQKRNVAMMFQSDVLFPHMTVCQNLEFGQKVRKVPKALRLQKIKDVSRTLALTDLLERFPHQLSGGQRQRVSLGRAILHDPHIYLLDEPLSNLDAKMRVQMRQEIARIHKELSNTMLFVTHDQTEAMTLGTRIVVLQSGQIQQIADPLTIYNHPANTFVATFIGTPPMNLFSTPIYPLPPDHIPLKIEGKSVIQALRPEHIRPVFPGQEASPERASLFSPPNQVKSDSLSTKSTIQAKVHSIEHLGSQTAYHCIATESNTPFISLIPSELSSTPHNTIDSKSEPRQFTFNPSDLHYFDPTTQRRIDQI